jgi:hypothetical protein
VKGEERTITAQDDVEVVLQRDDDVIAFTSGQPLFFFNVELRQARQMAFEILAATEEW